MDKDAFGRAVKDSFPDAKQINDLKDQIKKLNLKLIAHA